MKRFLVNFRVSCFLIVLFTVWFTLPTHAQFGDKKRGDPRIAKALSELNFRYTMNEDGSFKLVPLKLPSGRSQIVVIESKTERYGGLEIREIASAANTYEGLVPQGVSNYLLRQSFENKLGFWTIKLLGHDDKIFASGLSVALFVVRIAADGDSKTLGDAIRNAAGAADEVEILITKGKDAW